MVSFKSLLLLLAAIGALVGAWQAAQIRRRMAKPTAANRCIACDSPSLEVMGLDAYRCIACGYEGGVGQRALAEQKSTAKYAGMDVQERQRRARRSLQHALHALMGAPLRPQSENDPEVVAQWASAVESCVLAVTRELEEALRAAGGVLDIPGHGELDPSPLIGRLRQAYGGEEITFRNGGAPRARRLLAEIDHVRDALQTALRGVPSEPDRSSQLGQYRS